MPIEVTIEALGSGGDGIARHDGAKLFVPGVLPGERVRIAPADRGDHAELVERLSEAPGRQAPPCRHFGVCGGCVAQHMAGGIYGEWKRAMIRDALVHQGFRNVPISPSIASPPASRRRVRLAVGRTRGKPGAAPDIGFRRRASHGVAAIEHCAVMLPELDALIAPLGRLAAAIGSGVSDISLTAAAEGRELVLHGLDGAPDLAMREALAEFTHAEGIQRLSVEYRETPGGGRGGARARGRVGGRKRGGGRGGGGGQKCASAPVLETIAQPGAVRAHFGTVAVDLPPGAFLQPTASGEAAIQRLVRDGLVLGEAAPDVSHPAGGKGGGGGARVADLYSGLGGIGFALASRHQVVMYEGNRAMAEAASRAAGTTGRNVAAESRDLARRPLAPGELNRFDAAIFDPPRAGARALAEALAASQVPLVAAVSCNPATFARDARILVEGGYRLEALTPIDQFLWSRHVELVALFRRAP